MDFFAFLFEFVLLTIGPIYALIGAYKGYKTYLKYEIFGNVLFGLILILRPKILFSLLLNTEFKPYHAFLTGLYGCYCLHNALNAYMVKDSPDKGVFYGHKWSKIIEAIMIIIDNVIVYMESVHWNYRLMFFSAGFSAVILLINAYFLFIEPKPTGNLVNQVNQLAKIDFVILFATGIFMYAFPDNYCFGLQASDNSYRSIARASGAMVTAGAFHSLYVSEFFYSNDKKNLMLSRLFGNLIELFVVFIGYYILNALNLEGAYIFVACNMGYSTLVLYGYLITPENEKSKSQ